MLTRAAPPRTRAASWAGLLLSVATVVGLNQGWQAWSASRLGSEVAARAAPGDIEMLATASCVYCAQARSWFAEHKVAYAECDIERQAACAAKFSALVSPGTPMLLVRGQRQVGFNPERVAQALRAPTLTPTLSR